MGERHNLEMCTGFKDVNVYCGFDDKLKPDKVMAFPPKYSFNNQGERKPQFPPPPRLLPPTFLLLLLRLFILKFQFQTFSLQNKMKLHFDLLFNRLIFIVLSLLELFMLFLVIEEIRNGSDGLKRMFFYKASITYSVFVIITYLNVHSFSQKLPIICFRPCMEAAYKGA